MRSTEGTAACMESKKTSAITLTGREPPGYSKISCRPIWRSEPGLCNEPGLAYKLIVRIEEPDAWNVGEMQNAKCKMQKSGKQSRTSHLPVPLPRPIFHSVSNCHFILRTFAFCILHFAFSFMIDSDFRWATGVECSFIPHLGIDQYKWTQHDRFWRQDFQLIGQRPRLQMAALRPALARDRTPAGQYDWTMVRPAAGAFRGTRHQPDARPRALRHADVAARRVRGPRFPGGAGTLRPRLRRTLHRARALRLPGQRAAHHLALLRRHRPVAALRARVEPVHDDPLARRPGALPRREGPARDDARRGNPRLRLAGSRRDLRGFRPRDEPVPARDPARRRDPPHAPPPHRHRPRARAHRPRATRC